MLAFGANEAVDVTRRYSADWAATLGRRTAVGEPWLELTIATLNETRQSSLSEAARGKLGERAASERRQLRARLERALAAAEKVGRTTGSLEWRRARGELGCGSGSGGDGGGGGEGGGGKGSGEAPRVARVARVCGAAGGAVHGLCFESPCGSRWGSFLENSTEPVDLEDDAALVRRGGRWETLEPSEHIVRVEGRASTMGYLCAQLVLRTSSAREITFSGCVDESQPRFDALAPEGEAIVGLDFVDGTLVGVCAALAREGEQSGGREER